MHIHTCSKQGRHTFKSTVNPSEICATIYAHIQHMHTVLYRKQTQPTSGEKGSLCLNYDVGESP